MYITSVCITRLLPEPAENPRGMINMGVICERMPGVGESENWRVGPARAGD